MLSRASKPNGNSTGDGSIWSVFQEFPWQTQGSDLGFGLWLVLKQGRIIQGVDTLLFLTLVHERGRATD